ncbi:hypothetical protein [Pseudoalteromonas sp. BDTF-M6]|uniref:hypothetical protein n=1 Tax=Pseudoalteromonas sp. BDTF-M6 TaxID=2796132 RepID=UPI001BAE5C92|nr:hypothetical protein [Pseudoalteromonas sp. BDTF-M6]MBS3796369.1 hypothetical protein [Pseudoalteromonas sp. BDTF-M6]
MKKLGLALLISSALTGCASTSTTSNGRIDNSHLTNLFKPTTAYKKDIFAKLEKIDDGYEFTEFTLDKRKIDNKSYAWVNLMTSEPTWDYQRIQRCTVTTVTGNDSSNNPCSTASEIRFMERQYDAIANAQMAIATVGLSAAIASYMLVEFQPEEYTEAYTDALTKIGGEAKLQATFGPLSKELSKLEGEALSYNTLRQRYSSMELLSAYEYFKYENTFNSFPEVEAFAESLNTLHDEVQVKKESLEQSLKLHFVQQQRDELSALSSNSAKHQLTAYLDKYKNHEFADENLTHQAEGYLLHVVSEELDKRLFEEKVARAAQLKAVQDPANIGSQVCRDGQLNYVGVGYSSLHRQEFATDRSDENGQVLAFIEGHSPDKNRLKLRIKGYTVKSGTLRYLSDTTPSLDGLSAPIGAIVWDSANNWYICVS